MADKPQSLAEFLGVEPVVDDNDGPAELIAKNLTGEQFAEAVLHSVEFRLYIINTLRLGSIPPAVLTRLMDMSKDWRKQADKLELTGKDGQPFETITEVRRVVVRPEPVIEEPYTEKPTRTVTH